MSKHTVSFTILDDLCSAYGPVHETFTGEATLDNIREAVSKILTEFKEGDSDPSGYYLESIDESEISAVSRNLCSKKYSVINRYEKYYVIAFSLDYTRFEVFSKDCNKELISWGRNNEKATKVEQITDPEYNMNPVLKMFMEANKK